MTRDTMTQQCRQKPQVPKKLRCHWRQQQEKYTQHIWYICMSRQWEKYSGKIQNILEYMLRSNKKWSTCTKEEAIVNNNDINIYKYTNVCTTPRENHIEHIISISFYKPWEWELCYHTHLPVSNRLITLGKQKDDEIQWVKKNRKWKRRHHCFHDLAQLTQSL